MNTAANILEGQVMVCLNDGSKRLAHFNFRAMSMMSKRFGKSVFALMQEDTWLRSLPPEDVAYMLWCGLNQGGQSEDLKSAEDLEILMSFPRFPYYMTIIASALTGSTQGDLDIKEVMREAGIDEKLLDPPDAEAPQASAS